MVAVPRMEAEVVEVPRMEAVEEVADCILLAEVVAEAYSLEAEVVVVWCMNQQQNHLVLMGTKMYKNQIFQ